MIRNEFSRPVGEAASVPTSEPLPAGTKPSSDLDELLYERLLDAYSDRQWRNLYGEDDR